MMAEVRARQCDHRRRPARKLLLLLYEFSPYLAETRNPIHSLPAGQQNEYKIWKIFCSNCLFKQL